jgi:glycerol-3-phosphate cytidylyltransferase
MIGVNTDASVRELKGPSRPINSEDDRAEILAALRCVDYTVLFNEQTPEALISELKPDVHVKAGDYTEAQLPEAKIVRSYGGDVVIAPFVAGKSTTKTIEKINNATDV